MYKLEVRLTESHLFQCSLDAEVSGGRDAGVKLRENENSPECKTLTLSALEEDSITE